MRGTIHIYPTGTVFREAVAKAIVEELSAALGQRTNASLVLSGGSTPEAIYRLLGSDPFRALLDWSRVHFFWSDERYVDPAHPHSNYGMVRRAMLDHLAVPASNIHRIETEYDPATAARRYEKTVRTFFSLREGEFPQFDLVLLGLGEDGHTASLFPNTAVLDEQRRIAAEVFVPAINAYRLTLTLPVINNARCVMFLVAGSQKARIVSVVLEGDAERYPAQRVRPARGRLLWFVDTEAAAFLQHHHVTVSRNI